MVGREYGVVVRDSLEKKSRQLPFALEFYNILGWPNLPCAIVAQGEGGRSRMRPRRRQLLRGESAVDNGRPVANAATALIVGNGIDPTEAPER